MSFAHAIVAARSRLMLSSDEDFWGEGIAVLLAENSLSSSILGMLPAHLRSAPESRYVGEEQVRLSTLDAIYDSLRLEGRNVCLKIDTQGFEESVLKGAEKSLQLINTIQAEASLTPLYDGEMLFPEMLALLAGKGFKLVSVELGLEDPQNGRLLQLDGIFHRYPD